MGFKLLRTDVTDRLMEPLPTIEDIDELEHLSPPLMPRVVVPVMDQLALQGAEEALDDGIVIQLPFRRMAGGDLQLVEQTPIREARVLGSLIRVVNPPGLGPPTREGHLQCLNGHGLIGLDAHRPATHTARVQVEHDR